MQTSSDVFKYIRSVPLTSPRLIACSASLRNSCTWRIVGGAKSITGMWCIFILTPYSDGGSSVRDTKCWTPASARNVTSSLLVGLPRPANLLGTSHEKFKGIIIRHATRHVEPKPVVIKRKQSNHASVACVNIVSSTRKQRWQIHKYSRKYNKKENIKKKYSQKKSTRNTIFADVPSPWSRGYFLS